MFWLQFLVIFRELVILWLLDLITTKIILWILISILITHVKLLPNKLTYKLHKFTSSLKMAKI